MSAIGAYKTQDFSFAAAEALVFDPVPANRQATRTALASAGFGRVIALPDLDAFTRAWSAEPFDLLVADVTQDADPVFDLVRTIRDGRVGRNPFVLIMLTAWRLEGDLVKSALNCGADDLVTRPFSVDTIASRIRVQAEGRKPFVVTGDYIGPDRRRERPANSPNLIQVPNVLLAKARGTAKSTPATLEEIKAVQKRVEAERIRRGAFKIACLWHTLNDTFQAKQPLDSELAKLDAAAKDIAQRLACTPLKAAQQAAATLVEEVGKASGADASNPIATMDGLARTLLETLHPSRDQEELRQEVLNTVAMIRSRERK